MSSVVFSVSPRLAAVTAATRVDSAGLLLAAVATGSSVIPVKLPSPSAGTAEQPAPKGSSDAGMALLSAASLELMLVSADAAVSDASSEPQALSVRATVETAVMRTPRVRRLLFTVMVLLVLSVRPHCRGRVVRRSAGSGPECRVTGGCRDGCGSGRGPEGWSAGDHLDGVPAAGAGGEGRGALLGLLLAVRAGGAHGDHMPAGAEVVGQHPLAPQVSVD